MVNIALQCPSCGRRFNAKAPSPAALQGKTFVCKHCGARAPLTSVISPQRPAPLKTTIGGAGMGQVGGTPKTRFAGAVATRKPCLDVETTGVRHSLGAGTFILGRQSSDSKATLPIAPDRYMSRMQAKLTVQFVNSEVNSSIEVLNQVNPVYVNNIRLVPGKSYRLKPGDRILMGMTGVRYVEC